MILAYTNLLHFFRLTMKYQKRESKKKKKLLFKVTLKKQNKTKQTLKNKPDQGGIRLICWEL